MLTNERLYKGSQINRKIYDVFKKKRTIERIVKNV